MARRKASFSFSGLVCSMGVSVGPGQTQLTLIECRATSRASDLVKAMTPPLAAAYVVSPELPTRPASLATSPGAPRKDRSDAPSATADTRQRFRPPRVDFADFRPRHFLWQGSGKVATITLNRPERKNP